MYLRKYLHLRSKVRLGVFGILSNIRPLLYSLLPRVEISTGRGPKGTTKRVGPQDFLAKVPDWSPTFSICCLIC